MDKEILKDVVFCKEEDSILEVSRILRDTRVRHLIVINSERVPLGIISTIDINNRVVSLEKDTKKTKASEIMTKPLTTIDLNSSYEEAYKKIIEIGTYSLPVTEKGKLIGQISFNQLFYKCEVSKK